MSGIAGKLRTWMARKPAAAALGFAAGGLTDPEPPGPLDDIEAALGYRFRDRRLLQLALVHRSFAAEAGTSDSYERLEFLGDAVLDLAVSHYLYESYPQLAEGQMAKVRAAVVDTSTLAGLAREFGIGDAVSLGRGEESTGGREKDSILADVVESLLGAVYLDSGFVTAASLITRHWKGRIDRRAMAPGERDYKTRLQEKLAEVGRQPRYELREEGPDHAKEFTAEVWVEDTLIGVGRGTSKKRAEQQAARDAAARGGGSDA